MNDRSDKVKAYNMIGAFAAALRATIAVQVAILELEAEPYADRSALPILQNRFKELTTRIKSLSKYYD